MTTKPRPVLLANLIASPPLGPVALAAVELLFDSNVGPSLYLD